MEVLKCDECGALSDDRVDFPPEDRSWRTISVRRAREGWHEWSPGMVGTGDGWTVTDASDTWPGSSRWRLAYGGNPPLVIHLCSETCLLAGLKKLHKGARIVAFAGFSLNPEALNACLAVGAELAKEAAAVREP